MLCSPNQTENDHPIQTVISNKSKAGILSCYGNVSVCLARIIYISVAAASMKYIEILEEHMLP